MNLHVEAQPAQATFTIEIYSLGQNLKTISEISDNFEQVFEISDIINKWEKAPHLCNSAS